MFNTKKLLKELILITTPILFLAAVLYVDYYYSDAIVTVIPEIEWLDDEADILPFLGLVVVS